MKQKGLAPIVILLTLVVLGVIVARIVYFKGKTKQSTSVYPQPTTSSSNQTADWKTYKNQQYGFSMDIPSSLTAQEKQYSTYSTIHFANDFNQPSSNYFDFGEEIYPNALKSSLQEWVENYVIQDLPSGKKGSIVDGRITPYLIYGAAEKEGSLKGLTFIGGKESKSKFVVFSNELSVIDGKTVFVFSLNGSGTGGSYIENPDGEKTFTQILSTFRFSVN